MQIKRMGVFSVAKIYAVITAVFGLIIGVIYGLITIIFGAAIMAGRDGGGVGGLSIIGGLVMMIAFPIIYGIIGFIAGAIAALVYNVAAGFVGGVELELEAVANAYATPPPPQYGANPNQYQPGQQQYPY
jgi:hypothetical protein